VTATVLMPAFLPAIISFSSSPTNKHETGLTQSCAQAYNKQQGDWGEMILESILEDSGLNKGEQYHVQSTLKDEEGRVLSF
jgi:DNA recombination protein RmuC